MGKEIRSQTAQEIWIDKVFASRTEEIVPIESGVLSPDQLEVLHVDVLGDRETEVSPDDDTRPLVINITGAWGRGTEVEGEITTWAIAMEDKGFGMDCISMPEHGASGKLENSWENPEAFQKSAEAMIAYLKKVKKTYPQRKIIINALSMGGVTALRIAATAPELIDGIVLMDTPTFPMKFTETALDFITYGIPFVHGIKNESSLNLKAKMLGIFGVFRKRIEEANIPQGGMSKQTVLNSGRMLAQEDLMKRGSDGSKPLLAFAEREIVDDKHRGKSNKTQILLLRGSNDWVIPKAITNRLNLVIKAMGGHIEMEELLGAGHGLALEQPGKAGRIIQEWMKAHNLLANTDQKRTTGSLDERYDIKKGQEEVAKGLVKGGDGEVYETNAWTRD